MMFDVTLYLSLIAYAALFALMMVQIHKNGQRAESIGWLMFGIHGFIMILAFIVDSADGVFDAQFYNIWSNSVHLQGMTTLLTTEITRYLRMRGENIMDEITKYVLGNMPGIIGALLSIFLAYRQFKKEKIELNRALQRAPIEDTNMAISASNSAATAIKSYSDEIAELRKEISDMRKEQGDMQKQIDRLQAELDEKDRIIEEWRIGIGRLLGQFKDRRIAPVWQPNPAFGQDDRRKDW